MKKMLFPLLIVSMVLGGCFKEVPAVDFSTVGTIIEIIPPFGGLENFGNAGLVFPAGDLYDSEQVVVNIASPKPLSVPLTVTLAINDSALSVYNATNGTSYIALPDSTFSFPTTSVTIPAGSHLDTLTVYFYPSKIDSTQSYMLPIGISNAQGKTISGNFSIIYFHFDPQ
jgi:Domain of unknown function (DUF1735)